MSTEERPHKYIFTIFTILAAIQAGFAIFSYLQIPSDPSNAVLLGLSKNRLFLLSIPAGMILIGAWAIVAFQYGWYNLDHFYKRFHQYFQTPENNRRFTFFALFFIAVCGILLLYTTWDLVIERLRPLLVLLGGVVFQGLIFVQLFAFGTSTTLEKLNNWVSKPQRFRILVVYALAFISFWSANALIRKIGADTIGWNTTGTPITDANLLVALAFISAVLVGGATWQKYRKDYKLSFPKKADIILFFLIWAIAALIWSLTPLKTSWYLSEPSAPNFVFSPASDALIYDLTAQNMLVGEGLTSNPFDEITVRRPLYTFFVGLLRTLVGQNYQSVANIQAILFSVLPAIVYLIVRRLSGRFGGIVAALFVLIQGHTAISLSDVISISHSKLLMSDIPTGIGIAAFIFLVLSWVHTPDSAREQRRLLIAGGVLGGLILIRFETLLLLPLTVGFAFLSARWKFRPVLSGALLLSVGFMLFISPWLYRNYARTGEIFIEIPGNRLDFLSARLLGQQIPLDEEVPKVDPRMILQVEPTNFQERIASHFLHSNIQSVLIFPSTIRLGDAAIGFTLNRDADHFLASCCDGEDYVRRLPFWQWYKWDLSLSPEIMVMIVFNILLLSVGLVLAWQKMGWAGLLPFAYSETHMLINAVARTSGGRYLTPVEWIWISYYAIGLLFVFLWSIRLITPLADWEVVEKPEDPITTKKSQNNIVLPALIIFGLGSLLPIGEQLYPRIYPQETPVEWLVEAQTNLNLESLIDSPGGVVLHGRSIHFRYYSEGEGEAGRSFPNLYAKLFERTAFFVAGPTSSGVLLPFTITPELKVPPDEDVLVIGCRIDAPRNPYTEAVLVYFPNLGYTLTQPTATEQSVCPLPVLDNSP